MTLLSRLLFALGAAWVFSGCSAVPSSVAHHYQGHWEVGDCWEGFTTIDQKHTYYIEMPTDYDHFFMQEGPSFHDPHDGDFVAAYVDVDGYLSPSQQDPAHQTLHVVHVYQVSRSKKPYRHPTPPPAPNNALQRTEVGGRLSLALHVLLRQPLSLRLNPLGLASRPIK